MKRISVTNDSKHELAVSVVCREADLVSSHVVREREQSSSFSHTSSTGSSVNISGIGRNQLGIGVLSKKQSSQSGAQSSRERDERSLAWNWNNFVVPGTMRIRPGRSQKFTGPNDKIVHFVTVIDKTANECICEAWGTDAKKLRVTEDLDIVEVEDWQGATKMNLHGGNEAKECERLYTSPSGVHVEASHAVLEGGSRPDYYHMEYMFNSDNRTVSNNYWMVYTASQVAELTFTFPELVSIARIEVCTVQCSLLKDRRIQYHLSAKFREEQNWKEITKLIDPVQDMQVHTMNSHGVAALKFDLIPKAKYVALKGVDIFVL